MWTPLVTALAKFVAAIGGAVMAFRDLQKKQKAYDEEKEKKKLEQQNQQ